jgi:pimeloyl-ACP methyl ester carboxylesterase
MITREAVRRIDDGEVAVEERSLRCITAGSSTFTLPPVTDGAPTPPMWPALTNGVHRVVYTDHGPPDAEDVVVCVHGFARNGRDFDVLAGQLASRPGRPRRVVCPDMPGRGRSDWLTGPGPDVGYNLPQYVLDAAALVARTGADQVDWIGTSMGGLIGMALAALPQSPIRRLVLNDTGAEIPGAFLDGLAAYIGLGEEFDSVDELESYLRVVYAGFGALDDDRWRHLAEHGGRPLPDGRLALAYDPALARTLNPPHADQSLWALWESIRCPVLLVRGETSPLVSRETAERMATTGPRADVVEIAGCGHAPSLMTDAQVSVVETWLDRAPTNA